MGATNISMQRLAQKLRQNFPKFGRRRLEARQKSFLNYLENSVRVSLVKVKLKSRPSNRKIELGCRTQWNEFNSSPICTISLDLGLSLVRVIFLFILYLFTHLIKTFLLIFFELFCV